MDKICEFCWESEGIETLLYENTQFYLPLCTNCWQIEIGDFSYTDDEFPCNSTDNQLTTKCNNFTKLICNNVEEHKNLTFLHFCNDHLRKHVCRNFNDGFILEKEIKLQLKRFKLRYNFYNKVIEFIPYDEILTSEFNIFFYLRQREIERFNELIYLHSDVLIKKKFVSMIKYMQVLDSHLFKDLNLRQKTNHIPF